MTRELILDIFGWIFIGGIVLALVFASPRIRQMQINKKMDKARKKAEAFSQRMSTIREMEQNAEQQENEASADSTNED